MNYKIYALDELLIFSQKACRYIPREATKDEFIRDDMYELIMAPPGAIKWTGYERFDVDMFSKIIQSVINRHTKGDDPLLEKAFLCCSGRQRHLGQILLARKWFLEELPTNPNIPANITDAVRNVCGIWIPAETAYTDRMGGLRYVTENWVKI